MSLISLLDGSHLTTALYKAIALSGSQKSTKEILQMLLRRIEAFANFAQCHISIAFDLPGDNWRRELYPAYKAQRDAKDVELAELLDAAVDALQERYEVLAMAGIEADDLIASRWQHAMEVGCQVVIVSADKDLWQLLRAGRASQLLKFKTEHGKLIGPRWQTRDAFFSEFEFEPERWPLYRAMAGDKSDNIAGIAGLSDVAAKAICKRYATFEEAIDDRWKTPLNKKQFAAMEAAVKGGLAATLLSLCTLRKDIDLALDESGVA